MPLYFIGGVSGVGKTTICCTLAGRDDRFWHINGASLLMERLGLRSGDYDSLRSFSEKAKAAALVELLSDIREEVKRNGKTALYCGHYVKLLNSRCFLSNGDWFKCVDGLVMVWASPFQILKRIDLDEKSGVRTNRALFDCSDKPRKVLCLARAQVISLYGAVTLAMKYNKPFRLIYNPQGSINSSLDALREFVK